jgi:RNA polymerase sigma-70 factor, ECF subfamily
LEFFSFDDVYLDRLRSREFKTEQHFVAYFNKLLLIKLRSRLSSSHAMEDICQETFVRVLKAVADGGIRSGERLGAYVNSVCNNVLLEFYRSNARHELADEQAVAEVPDKAIDLDGLLVSKQTQERVHKVLAGLPEKDRRLLTALFIYENDKDNICREFGVNREYLRVLLHRAKQAFRAAYNSNPAQRRTSVEC